MAYYEVKTNFLEPVEGSDEFKKVNKVFLVDSESCTEAEVRIVEWHPSNYRSFTVDSVKKSNISEIKTFEGEYFFLAKLMNDDDGRGKARPYFVLYEARNISSALEYIIRDWHGTEIEELKKYKNIVDEDLITP